MLYWTKTTFDDWKVWHLGDSLDDIRTAHPVVAFQADGDELAALVDGLTRASLWLKLAPSSKTKACS